MMKNTLLVLLFASTLFSCGELSKKIDLVNMDQKVRQGQFESAKEDLLKYLKLRKDNEYAWTLMGIIHENLEEDSLAIIAFEKALAIDPEIEEAITGMGIQARKAENYEKAVEYYEKALEINPKYAQAYSSLVTIYIKQKQFNRAVSVGQKAYDLDKKDPVIAANLSIAYHYTEDIPNRDKYYEIAKQLKYRNLESLKDVFSGELILFDED